MQVERPDERLYSVPVNIEFHYYTVFFLAQRSGFNYEHSGIIAYSSQFVDSNIIQYSIDTGSSVYTTLVTQNYGFWKSEALRKINVPFHFIPGGPLNTEESPRRDRNRDPLLTLPNAPYAKQLLIDALKSKDLYRIGIALHSFADTWAHQNFCGIHSPLNRLGDGGIIPPIGHAQALRNPDSVELTWNDPRLSTPEINNRTRFLSAAKKIYRYLCTFNGRNYDDEELTAEELKLLYKKGKSTEERILDFIIGENIEKFSRNTWLEDVLGSIEDPGDDTIFKGYNKVLWLKDEVLYGNELIRKKPYKAVKNFYTTHLYRWMEAAKTHQQKGLALFGHLLPAERQ